MKSITVSDETWQKLTIKKAEQMAGDLNEVIEKLLLFNPIQTSPDHTTPAHTNPIQTNRVD